MSRKFKTKICPKCGIEHNKSGVFCSRSCANSRKFSKEARKKKSVSNKKFWDSLSEEEKDKKKKILKDACPYDPSKYAESLMTQDWDAIGCQGKRLRVLLEQNGCCNSCGIFEWRGKLITLELEHKDGNNGNNNRENLEALCPNCHSQTKTWRGRNNRKRQNRVDKYIELGAAGGLAGPLITD